MTLKDLLHFNKSLISSFIPINESGGHKNLSVCQYQWHFCQKILNFRVLVVRVRWQNKSLRTKCFFSSFPSFSVKMWDGRKLQEMESRYYHKWTSDYFFFFFLFFWQHKTPRATFYSTMNSLNFIIFLIQFTILILR